MVPLLKEVGECGLIHEITVDTVVELYSAADLARAGKTPAD